MNKLVNSILSYLFTERSWINQYERAASNVVAAGDPAHGIYNDNIDNLPAPPTQFQIDNQEIAIDSFNPFVVDGWSMYPEGICSGDILLCEPYKNEEDSNSSGLSKRNLVIIDIDKEYYAHKRKDVKYDIKLRKTIFKVKPNTDFATLLNTLKDFEDSVLIEDNQNLLKKKYDDTYKYYSHEREMMLSITYKEGRLRYSFHPLDLIKYTAKYVLKFENQDWNIKKV